MTTLGRPRIAPLEPPYDDAVAETLRRMMPPGIEPLALFRTVAHNPAILDRFRSIGAYILNFGTVDPLDREVLLHRTCARCGCEYEWGVHVVAFGRPLGLSQQQIRATVLEGAETSAWSGRQRLLVRLADELHDTATVSAPLWDELAAVWDDAQLIELIATAGFYHLVSYMANAAGVAPEAYAERFPAAVGSGNPSGR
jgi:4-carboxymuconolactone decarboxylase